MVAKPCASNRLSAALSMLGSSSTTATIFRRFGMKHLGFRLTGKPSQAQISTVRIYDRIDARRDLPIGEVDLDTALIGPRRAFELVCSSPPRQIPPARAPNTSDVQ